MRSPAYPLLIHAANDPRVGKLRRAACHNGKRMRRPAVALGAVGQYLA